MKIKKMMPVNRNTSELLLRFVLQSCLTPLLVYVQIFAVVQPASRKHARSLTSHFMKPEGAVEGA